MSTSTVPAQVDQVVPGGSLTSGSSSYRVLSFLGQGAYGKVVKCLRMNDRKTVAIKLMKQQGDYLELANDELAALNLVKSLDPDKCNIVRWHQVFIDKGFVCLEFEHLDKSLFDLLQERDFRPLSLREIRPIVQQVANSLNYLKAMGIIHSDIKLDNVMLVNHVQEPYRVKLIDFGVACKKSAATVGSYIQGRPYRSPEIILGIPFTEAIDMWSLGCMAAALYVGKHLYPGKNEYEVMRYIVETQGQPADHILSHGQKTRHFFLRDKKSTTSQWKLRSPQQYYKDLKIRPKNRQLKLTSLDDLLHVRAITSEDAANKAALMNDALMFVDMLKAMLRLDASERITPCQLLEHQFINMHHLRDMYHHSIYVRFCFQMMDRCQNKNTSSDGETNACGSLQQNKPTTANPVQLKHHPPEKSSTIQHHHSNTHPCTSTKLTGSERSCTKRKIQEKDTDRSVPTGAVKRKHVDKTLHHRLLEHPSPSLKTKAADDGDYSAFKKNRTDHYVWMQNPHSQTKQRTIRKVPAASTANSNSRVSPSAVSGTESSLKTCSPVSECPKPQNRHGRHGIKRPAGTLECSPPAKRP